MRDILDTKTKQIIVGILVKILKIFFKTPEEGAQTSLYLVLEREDKLVQGAFYKDCKVAKI